MLMLDERRTGPLREECGIFRRGGRPRSSAGRMLPEADRRCRQFIMPRATMCRIREGVCHRLPARFSSPMPSSRRVEVDELTGRSKSPDTCRNGRGR